MSRAELVRRLGERIGLDPAALGEVVLDHAFADARRALGLRDDRALLERCLRDPAAFEVLIGTCTVPETWFFRAPEQFDDLVRFATGEAAERRPFQVLCLPCASGEEAWSAAIRLAAAGLAPGQFNVLGVDIGADLVERATRGHYRNSALRGQSPPAWTDVRPDGFCIDPALRAAVRFRAGNALDGTLFQPGEHFDAVFCRNLIIYLDAPARQRVLDNLCRAMTAPAILCTGQAEILPTIDSDFAPYDGASPLTYRYDPARRLQRRRDAAAAAPAAVPVLPPLSPATRPVEPVPRTAPIALAVTRSPDRDARRRVAQAAADDGRLDEARSLCLELIADDAGDVASRHLLGVVELARNDLAAADAAFTQVLYLDPGHLEAAELRAALAERLGDRSGARRLRARAKALRDRGSA